MREVFGNSPVELSTAPGKFTYIAKREIAANSSEVLSFLGYEFELKDVTNSEGSVISFKYGIAEKKRRKYSGIIERSIIQYTKDHNLELLRQRIKIYSSRVVIGRTIGSSTFDWLTKGIVANYNELQHHVDALRPDTLNFLKNLYFQLMIKHGVSIPYFMRQSAREESIYNILSNMKRNRSIIFQDSIGVSRGTLVKWMRKIDSSYSDVGKDYYRIVVEYLDMIKIE